MSIPIAAVATPMAMWCIALILLAPVALAVHPMHNGGTPAGIPPLTDCNLRLFAWEAGQKLMPRRGTFKTLYDAMQLDACGIPGPTAVDQWKPPSDTVPSGVPAVYVDSAKGNDAAAGTEAAPFRTIGRGLQAATLHIKNAVTAAATGSATIVLRAGVYHGCDGAGNVCVLGAAQSGLTIMNAPGEEVTVTGGQPLAIAAADWKKVPIPRIANGTVWKEMTDMNGVSGRAGNPTPSSDTKCCKFLGVVDSLQACEAAAVAAVPTKGPFAGVTYHTDKFVEDGGEWRKHCYGVLAGDWVTPVAQQYIDSALNTTAPAGAVVYVADLNSQPGGKPAKFDGLRLGKQRAIRAKYPNGDPEKSGEWYIMGASQAMGGGEYTQGWDISPTTWLPHRNWGRPPQTEVVITAADWPDVEWPMHHPGGDDTWTGEGDWGEFHAGYGGTCDDVEPPFGYWCAKKPPRGISQHWSPSGVVWQGHLTRGANYTHPEDAVVVAWRGGGRWLTYIWSVDRWVVENGTALFTPGTGNQGGEGTDHGQEWYIEGVLEELDDAREWYYDYRQGLLYFAFNGTAPTEEQWVATRTKVLFNVTGSPQAPATNITIKGIQIRDTALTWLDTHGLPSGGDWALQRSGAITLEGTEGFTVSNSLFERIDGNGIMLNGWNRNATVASNEFAWVGATCVASWGYSSQCFNGNCSYKLPWREGPDARGGEQPRGTRVLNNLFREMGIFQKQASAYFHAKSGLTEIAGNIVFNGPRAMFNFNDGMLGGDNVHANLLANAVRESGDHSAVNSWDRMPYIHDLQGKATIIPLTRHDHHNFILGTYSTQEAFDTDDGSSYYAMYNNFLVYGSNGLKSDFGGHTHTSIGDIYAYIANCFGNGNYLQFVNNTCILNWQPDADHVGGYASDCHLAPGMVVHSNTVATPGGSLLACGTFLSEWVAAGHDNGTVSVQWPKDADLIAQAKSTLYSDPVWAGGATL